MSIFDSIIGSTSPFAEAALKLLEGSPSSTSKDSTAESQYYAESAAASKENRILNILQSGKMQNPYRQGDEFTASKSKPSEQVDSSTITQQWLQRLDRYASTPQVRGATGKGA